MTTSPRCTRPFSTSGTNSGHACVNRSSVPSFLCRYFSYAPERMVAAVPITPTLPVCVMVMAAGRLDRADDWDVVLLGKQVKRDSGHGVAGNDDRFQVILAQKRHILPGVLGDDIAAARTVRHAAGIAEIDDIFLRHQGVQTAHGGQTAQAGVKYANRTLIHCAPPVPERSGGRAARHSRCPRSQTAWGTC